jgi:hypothetical protein
VAFDMYLGDRREKIDENEEYIFTMASASAQEYPELLALWSRFYSSFQLSPGQASALIHELLCLLEEQDSPANKPLSALVLRLSRFFSAACRSNQPIACAGD